MALNIIEAEAGEHISNLVKRAQKQLAFVGMSFGYVIHNGVTVPLSVDSNVGDICEIHALKMKIAYLEKYN